MSKYVDAMRDALKGYQSSVQASKQRVDEIQEAYGKEASERQREREGARLEKERARAEAAIREAYSEGAYLAREWGKLAGGNLTEDAKLLDADLVTPDQFNEMKTKYADNYTMLSALKKYGERHNAVSIQEARDKGDHAGAWGAGSYNVRDIPTVEGKLETWNNLRQTALGMLDMLDSSGSYAGDHYKQAFAAHMGPAAVDQFGQGADV